MWTWDLQEHPGVEGVLAALATDPDSFCYKSLFRKSVLNVERG